MHTRRQTNSRDRCTHGDKPKGNVYAGWVDATDGYFEGTNKSVSTVGTSQTLLLTHMHMQISLRGT